jgi:hypothetical protein
MDLYHINSVMKYKYVGITDEKCHGCGSTGSSHVIFGLTGRFLDFFLK